jgi:hypothetical protein
LEALPTTNFGYVALLLRKVNRFDNMASKEASDAQVWQYRACPSGAGSLSRNASLIHQQITFLCQFFKGRRDIA